MINSMLFRCLSFLCKIGLSFLAIYLVYIKIDWNAFFLLWRQLDVFILLWVFLLYNFSQVLSALRMRCYLALIEIDLNRISSIYLCYLGMFYNLFLPGGIGGDGYKVYFLKRFYSQKTMLIVKALLGDRLNGFSGLLVIAFACFCFNGLFEIAPYQYALLLLCMLVGILGYALLQGWLFVFELKSFLFSLCLSITVQALQGLVAVILVRSLGDLNHSFIYVFIFLFSSIVSQLPLSMGGLGTREVTMVYCLNYLGIDPNAGLAMALIFFMCQTLSNCLGLFCYHFKLEPKPVLDH